MSLQGGPPLPWPGSFAGGPEAQAGFHRLHRRHNHCHHPYNHHHHCHRPLLKDRVKDSGDNIITIIAISAITTVLFNIVFSAFCHRRHTASSYQI